MKTNIKILLKELENTEYNKLYNKLSENELQNLWDWFVDSKLEKENIRDKASIQRFISWLRS